VVFSDQWRRGCSKKLLNSGTCRVTQVRTDEITVHLQVFLAPKSGPVSINPDDSKPLPWASVGMIRVLSQRVSVSHLITQNIRLLGKCFLLIASIRSLDGWISCVLFTRVQYLS
jgi:hypothetical protein